MYFCDVQVTEQRMQQQKFRVEVTELTFCPTCKRRIGDRLELLPVILAHVILSKLIFYYVVYCAIQFVFVLKCNEDFDYLLCTEQLICHCFIHEILLIIYMPAELLNTNIFKYDCCLIAISNIALSKRNDITIQ